MARREHSPSRFAFADLDQFQADDVEAVLPLTHHSRSSGFIDPVLNQQTSGKPTSVLAEATASTVFASATKEPTMTEKYLYIIRQRIL